MALMSYESAKDVEIQALKKQVEMDNLIKATMVFEWVAREAGKDREMDELKAEMTRLKAKLAEKEKPDPSQSPPLTSGSHPRRACIL